MELDALLNGLQEISFAEGLDSGFSPHYINSINTQIASYKDKIVSKLGLNNSAKLYGGAIQLEFGDNTRPFPEAQIRDMGEEHVFNQLGGGFLTDLKHFVFGRNINKFYAEFEKIMMELNDKVKPYEVEAEELSKFSNQKADKVRDLMLTGKSKAIMEVNLTDMDLDANRRDYLKKQIALANSNKPIFYKAIDEIAKNVQKKETDSTIFGITYKRSMVRRLKDEMDKKYKKFDKLVKKYEEYVDLITRGNNLREKYSKFTEAEIKNLLDDQKTEYKEYKAFDKKYAGQDYTNFTQTKLNEAKALLDKLSLSLIAINDYITAFNKINGQKAAAEKTLTDWERDVTNLFTNMNKAIKEGNTYKAALDRIKTLVEDNHNYLASVATRDLEPAVQEYDVHKRSVGYTKETMDKLVSTLVDIRNRFLKLEPAQNLIMDAFTISQARTYILAMMENISRRQTSFGGETAGGKKYIEGIVKKRQRGGAYPDIQQYGGVFNFTDNINVDTGANVIPIYFKHIGNDMVYFDGKYNKYSEIKKATVARQMDPVVLPYGALPLDDVKIDGVAAEYKLQNKYETFFNTVTQPVIYFPIYNIESERVTVYKVEIKPGFDIRDPSKNVSTVKVDAIKLKGTMEAFIKIKHSNNYYIYNINFANHELGKNTIKIYSIDDGANILLPVFYKMSTVNGGFMNYEEMHLINPITGAPILTVITELPKKDSTNPLVFESTNLNVALYGINSTDMLDDIPKDKDSSYYYHYNAIGIEYDVDNIEVAYGTDKKLFIGAKIKLSANDNCKKLHAALMFQVIDFTNKLVGKLLTDEEDNIGIDVSNIDAGGVELTILDIENINNTAEIFGTATADEVAAVILFAKTLFAKVLLQSKDGKKQPIIELITGAKGLGDTETITITGTVTGEAHALVTTGAPAIPALVAVATAAALTAATTTGGDTDDIAKAAAGAIGGDATVIAAAKAAADAAKAVPGATPASIATAAATAAAKAAAAASTSPTTALNPLMPSSQGKADMTDSAKRSIEYVLRLLPKSSKYWTNLGLIQAEIKKFYDADYKDNFEKIIAEITQAIFEMRKDEAKILGITVNIPKSPLPGYSMAVKDMEIKPNKEEGITTESAKELQNILSNNRQFIEKFQAATGVNSATLIQDLQPLFLKIYMSGKAANDVNVMEWFNADPSRQPYFDYIRTLPGAQDLERQLKSNPELTGHELKILRAIGNYITRGTPAYEKVYGYYETKGKEDDKKREEAKRQQAKGGYHRGHGRGGHHGNRR